VKSPSNRVSGCTCGILDSGCCLSVGNYAPRLNGVLMFTYSFRKAGYVVPQMVPSTVGVSLRLVCRLH
jgi:hypothetical protein